MAFTSAFFDAELVGGEYDRVYSAEKFAEYFAAFIANGVFPDPSTNLQVVNNLPSDMTVVVKPGLGWINGYYCKNDGEYTLDVSPANGTLPRIDAVVIRWSRSERAMFLEVKTGIANSSPVTPSLERSADNYELMLASIYVDAGVTSIGQLAITDKRPDSTVCGWVKGTVEQIDTTALFAQYDDAFQTWFADIQSQLSGDVATNLQNQINQLKTDKVNVSDKATLSEAQTGTNDTKWITPKVLLSSIKSNEKSSYMAFCANVNSDALDAAFGKNNVDVVLAIGRQLAMYSWFKGDSKSANKYTTTLTLDTLSSIYSNINAVQEVEKTGTIPALIEASPFAKAIRDRALSVESTLCVAIASKVGLSNAESYTSLNSLTASSTFMNNYNSLLTAFEYEEFCKLFVANNTAWTRMTSYTNAMKAFENSTKMQSYLQANKDTVLTYVSASGTTATDQVQTSGYCYILEFIGDGGNWSCKTTITTSVTGKTFNAVGSGGGKISANAFFHPCTITRTKTSATFSAYFKKIS